MIKTDWDLNANSSGFRQPRVPGDGHVGGETRVESFFVEKFKQFGQKQLLVTTEVCHVFYGIGMAPVKTNKIKTFYNLIKQNWMEFISIKDKKNFNLLFVHKHYLGKQYIEIWPLY